MAVMAGVLDETRRRTLEALCDTIVPSVPYDGDDETVRAYMARSAGDMGVAAQIEGLMAQAMLPEDIEGFGQLLDGLAATDFASLPLETRNQILKQVSASAPEAKLGIKVFKSLTLLFFYALDYIQWLRRAAPLNGGALATRLLAASVIIVVIVMLPMAPTGAGGSPWAV